VSVDLSSTSDAYFVKEFDRKDAYLKQMNQFHNHGIGPHRAVKDGKLFEFACGKGGDLGRWIAAWYGRRQRTSLDNLVNPERSTRG
jgi:hypothetical protein